MSVQKTTWGIIGLGKIAQRFAEGLSYVEGAELGGVASRSQEKAQRFAQKNSVSKAYASYAEICQDPDIDVIYIATPHTQHYENTLLCLEAGKSVLCEKPFAMNLPQAQEMIACAKKNKVFLMEALWTRFLPSYQKVNQWVQSGKLGEVNLIQADFGFKAPYDPQSRLFNPNLGGGALLDVGIYPVFLAISLLGKPVDIQAQAQFGPSGVDESNGVLLRFKSGTLALLSSSLVSYNSLEANIFGRQGRLKMSQAFHGPNTQLSFHPNFQEDEKIPFEVIGNGYNYEAQEVAQCLRSGKLESTQWSWQNTLDLMEVLDEIRKVAGIQYPAT